MDTQMRKRIVGIIETWIRGNGGMPLRDLKSVLRRNGIPEELLGQVQPKSWITNQFPEFIIVGTNGYEHIVIHDDACQILADTVLKEGQYLLAQVPALLKSHEIEWKLRANGKKLREWILDSYPGVFAVSDDNRYLCMSSHPISSNPRPSEPEAGQDPATRSHILQFCFFPTNAAMLRAIRDMTGDDSITPSKWAVHRTYALAQCLLGLNGGMLDDSQSARPRMAFHTGLKTYLGQDIYGIMEQNINEGASQKWIFSAAAFPGQETEEGHWLCRTFGIKPQVSGDSGLSETVSAISDALDAVREAQKALLNEHDSLRGYIEGGRMLSDAAAGSVVRYIEEWSRLKQSLEKLDDYQTEDLNSIDSVRQLLDEWNAAHKVQDELEREFAALADAAWKFMRDNRLCQDNFAAEDISSWSGLLQQDMTEETADQLRELLKPYQAVLVLRAADVFGDTEYESIDLINAHFRTRLKLKHLKYSICDKELDMDFLELIPKINSLVLQIESGSRAPKEKLPIDDSALLDAAMRGTLWKAAGGAFQKPNILEAAAMLGDTEAIRRITGDRNELRRLGYGPEAEEQIVKNAKNIQFSSAITPLHAAERLEQLLGPSAAVLDQCLLLGVMQREAGAADRLIQHYIDTKRYGLAHSLLSKSADMIQTETRRKAVLTLIEAGCASVSETIDSDILALLTDQGIRLVQSIPLEGGLKERLLTVHKKMEPTLIHHIAFLSPELQSYILQPENANELALYRPGSSVDDFAEILRQNTFARGNSPLQTAKRIYAFLGNRDDLALQLAMFSPDTPERQAFLFDLYYNKIDDLSMLRFLEQNQAIRQMHFPYYLDLLFRNQKYGEVYDAAQGNGALSAKETLQVMLSALKAEKPLAGLPDFDAGEALGHLQLVLDIGAELSARGMSQHSAFLKKIFPCAVMKLSEAELERLVSANGALSAEDLHRTAEGAAADCPALAVYCGNLLGIPDFVPLRDSYLQARYEMLGECSIAAQTGIVHELQILNPEKYAAFTENLFEKRLSEILGRDDAPASKAEKISSLLSGGGITANVVRSVIAGIEAQPIICCPPLYETLFSVIPDDESAVNFLEAAYRCWDQGDDRFRIFLCNQILSAGSRGQWPADLLVKCEDSLLEMFDRLDEGGVQRCILHIEEIRGRQPYISFARYAIKASAWQSSADGFDREDEKLSAELSLLCDALEDPALEIEEFLRYCAAFASASDADFSAGREDANPLLELHRLYRAAASADSWEIIERMIPQDRVAARAKALYFYALYLGRAEAAWKSGRQNDEWTVCAADTAWERCVNYCAAEGRDDLFFRAARSWLHGINNYHRQYLPSYSTKCYMLTMQRIFATSDVALQNEHSLGISFPACSKETALLWLGEMIAAFKRMDQDKIRDEAFNSLRTIMELSIQLDCEELLLEELSEKLTGAYVNLGLAGICRLLLAEKTEMAIAFLRHITRFYTVEYNYSPLINKLASMDTEELQDWLGIAGSRDTLRFILPNGNEPNLLSLQTLVMTAYTGGDNACASCIRVVENLLECYPRDVMCYKALFVLCKEDCGSHLPRIYRALVGIFKYYYDNKKARTMYTRERRQVLELIEILRQVMENTGEFDIKFESATDLIRGYYHSGDETDPDAIVSELNRLSEEVRNLFVGMGKGTQAFSLLTHSLLGSVTENWAPFLREAFQCRAADWLRTYCVDKYNSRYDSATGLLRGLLRVWAELPSDAEKAEFISWISDEMGAKGRVFCTLTVKTDPRSVNWSMLRLPWEEHLVCLGNLKDMSQPEKNCCYKVMMSERLKGQYAKDSFVLMLRLAQDYLKTTLLSSNAREWFRNGDYDLAVAAYEALSVVIRRPAEVSERYQTWMRISYAFSDADVSTRNCSPHSCMNMMCDLINEGYERYFDRLRRFFRETNLRLFDTVRNVLSSPMGEQEILQMAAGFKESNYQERQALIAFLHFVLSKNGDEYLFLSRRAYIAEAEERLSALEGPQRDDKKNKCWITLRARPKPGFLPVPDGQASDLAPDEGEPGPDAGETVSYGVFESNYENFMPRFVFEIESFCAGGPEEDIRAMADEYQKQNNYSDADFSKRLRLSALMYRHSRNIGDPLGEAKYLTQFGINYFNFHRNHARNNEDTGTSRKWTNTTMFDLAIYSLQTPAASAEVVKCLPNWFQDCIRSFPTIDHLLNDYTQNRRGYAAVKRLLSDTEYSTAANSLIEVFNDLLSASNRLGTRTLDSRSYHNAQLRLREVGRTGEWVEMFAALNEMLRQAINKLDQRPSLKVTVFNAGTGLRYDGIYGEIENTGRETAHMLELQAVFPDSDGQSSSSLYCLPFLRPNEKAAFAISYKAPAAAAELEYILNLSYNDKDTRVSKEAGSGTLAIEPNGERPDHTPQFNTSQAISFAEDEDGNVVSEDFKGRKSETDSLNRLLEGPVFSQYQSAIIQGIKRSGKTSLLNYLRAYIRAKKGDTAIQVFFDCQSITRPFVYKAFFKSVLDELPLEYEPVKQHPEWERFVARWVLPEEEADRDPEDLSLFFRQLHSMLDGKGLYLIIDEFDVLLHQLNDSTGYDPLLRALRTLQDNPDCQRAVHMVLCGSNYLLTYNQTGSAFNQFFQSYKIIPVGQMLVSDIQEMINDWLEQHPVIRFAQPREGGISPSIQWIERYTGGLVWYTRLLVNEAVQIVLKDNRSCVYPSDICRAFNSICIHNNCRQLEDGCDSNDKLVIDAMQSLSDRPRNYVSFEQLLQLLGASMSAEQLSKSLSKLTDSIELLEQKSPNVRSYRFRIELYRRYFRTRDSKFDKDGVSRQQVSGDYFMIAEADPGIKTLDSDSAFDDF